MAEKMPAPAEEQLLDTAEVERHLLASDAIRNGYPENMWDIGVNKISLIMKLDLHSFLMPDELYITKIQSVSTALVLCYTANGGFCFFVLALNLKK